MKFFLCVAGMLFVIEGLPYFAYPGAVANCFYLMVIQAKPCTLRIAGAVTVGTGLGLIYFGTR